MWCKLYRFTEINSRMEQIKSVNLKFLLDDSDESFKESESDTDSNLLIKEKNNWYRIPFLDFNCAEESLKYLESNDLWKEQIDKKGCLFKKWKGIDLFSQSLRKLSSVL